ncbi:hypothetical protein [Lysinibacillus composti]|uniref:hypothetical protein n=1 Tax=Lysinibacillus composti TaxID=720633 RepID=UPI00195F8A25|nr:hypothetical protein [Lysinibacillus composti]
MKLKSGLTFNPFLAVTNSPFSDIVLTINGVAFELGKVVIEKPSNGHAKSNTYFYSPCYIFGP